MSKEAQARLKINKLLEEGEWILIDTPTQRANVRVELKTNKEDGRGFADYVLLDDKGFPLVVLEAKSEDKDPLIGKEQARTYANSIHARFIILSNSNIHYQWDLERGNPTIINKFPTQKTLLGYAEYKPKKDLIIKEEVSEDYVARTQNPNYSKDPDYINPDTRKDYIERNKLVFLRPYQLGAIKSIQQSIKDGNDRFLFEMATGTGGLQRVPKDYVENYSIPLPSVETQKRVIGKIEMERQVIEGNKKLIEIYNQKIQDRINKIWGTNL